MASDYISKMTPRLRKAYKDGVKAELKRLGLNTTAIAKMSVEEFKAKTGFTASYNYIARGFRETGYDPSNEVIEQVCQKIGLSFSPIQFKPYDLL